MSSTMFMDPGNTLENRRQQRIAASRREWSQLPAADLDQVSGYVVDRASGNLFLPVTCAVLPGNSLATGAPKVDAFYVSHSTGEPIYLERSQSPATLDELRRRKPIRNGSGSRANRRPRKHSTSSSKARSGSH